MGCKPHHLLVDQLVHALARREARLEAFEEDRLRHGRYGLQQHRLKHRQKRWVLRQVEVPASEHLGLARTSRQLRPGGQQVRWNHGVVGSAHRQQRRRQRRRAGPAVGVPLVQREVGSKRRQQDPEQLGVGAGLRRQPATLRGARHEVRVSEWVEPRVRAAFAALRRGVGGSHDQQRPHGTRLVELPRDLGFVRTVVSDKVVPILLGDLV
jgi:hypothetical protein